MKELTIEGVNGAKTITNFSQSSGFNHYFTVNGGFIVDRNKTGSIDLYHELKETGVHDVLIEHYSKLFDLINKVMLDYNLDFTDYDRVDFNIQVNMSESFNYYEDLIVYSEDGDSDNFLTDISKRVFYDLIIEGIQTHKGEFYAKDKVTHITGIPHFAIPALINFLKKWLQLAETPVTENELVAVE
ncbi:MAG: hypothetical protein QXF12_04700 [Candidatus Aenigmatarchaeota archaeon]